MSDEEINNLISSMESVYAKLARQFSEIEEKMPALIGEFEEAQKENDKFFSEGCLFEDYEQKPSKDFEERSALSRETLKKCRDQLSEANKKQMKHDSVLEDLEVALQRLRGFKNTQYITATYRTQDKTLIINIDVTKATFANLHCRVARLMNWNRDEFYILWTEGQALGLSLQKDFTLDTLGVKSGDKMLFVKYHGI
jgi:hypothetical protein